MTPKSFEPFALGALPESTRLSPSFVAITEELRKTLTRIQIECDRFDKENKGLEEEPQVGFVKRLGQHNFPIINSHFAQLSEITRDFDKQTTLAHKSYFQNQLLSFFIRKDAPLNKQIYDKPRGYAGDYIVVNYFYEDGYPGFTTYGKFIDRYTLETPAARAHINRRKYLGSLIKKLVERRVRQRKKQEIRIASFACGSAIELVDFFRQPPLFPPDLTVSVSCIDGDPAALSDFQKKGAQEHLLNKPHIRINPVCKNILNLIRKRERLDFLINQDLIYCAGFLDYLSDRTACKFIEYSCSLLDQDGIFVGVNISSDDPLQVYLRMIGEWYLHHRSKTDLLDIAKAASIPLRHKRVLADPKTLMNLYLVVGR